MSNYLVNPAFYDVLDDWIFPGLAATDSKFAVVWKAQHLPFGSFPPMLTEQQIAVKKAIMSRANWSRIQELRSAYALRQQARYVRHGGTHWFAKQYPTYAFPDAPQNYYLKIAVDFITSGTFREIVFTAIRVVDIVSFILLIFSVCHFVKYLYDDFVDMQGFLDRLKPLPYIKDAKSTLKVHYLPYNPAPNYPYNPSGRKKFTFQHVKQEVQDADLHKLGMALVENGSVYKYRPHLLMYYEITCEVEFEVDLSVPS